MAKLPGLRRVSLCRIDPAAPAHAPALWTRHRPCEAFCFVEDVNSTDHYKYLWGNAACAFGACLTTAFAKYHWCAALLGAEGGGLVQGLPTHAYITDDRVVELKCPTEITITDPGEEELSKLGFIPLVHCKGSQLCSVF